jgi:cytoplasmic iron level regulating protein YaaA (DUF328/UPF0246 family)
MLIVISPAKKLDWTERSVEKTTPDFLTEANALARTMRNRTLGEIRKMMSLSEDLAKLNRDRYKSFSDTPEAFDLRPAVHAFAGDTYQGLDAGSLEDDEMAWAQDHLRILSGLYGVLRPLDAIQPYRLEMGTRLKTRRGGNLYDYWRDLPAKALRDQAEAVGTDILVNCASQEYFGAVQTEKTGLRIITPTFLEDKDGEAKIVSFFAKRARGAMARFIITRRLTQTEGLRDFDLGGYAYDAERSTPDAPVFVRPYQA